MAKGDDILERLIRFGVSVLNASSTFPKSTAGRHMADQPMRSATAGAPNFAEARSGESLWDFVRKLGIVRRELNESYVWLRMLKQVGFGIEETLLALLHECDELCRIIAASKKTAEGRLKQDRIGQREFRVQNSELRIRAPCPDGSLRQ
jgi:four helix bundle protein